MNLSSQKSQQMCFQSISANIYSRYFTVLCKNVNVYNMLYQTYEDWCKLQLKFNKLRTLTLLTYKESKPSGFKITLTVNPTDKNVNKNPSKVWPTRPWLHQRTLAVSQPFIRRAPGKSLWNTTTWSEAGKPTRSQIPHIPPDILPNSAFKEKRPLRQTPTPKTSQV